jgi:hypothetical protein
MSSIHIFVAQPSGYVLFSRRATQKQKTHNLTVADIDRINPVIQACLLNAEHLLNAAKDVRKPGQNHIAYHLAALALEEIGKITMLVVSAVHPQSNPGDDENGEVGSTTLTEDHARKAILGAMGSQP